MFLNDLATSNQFSAFQDEPSNHIASSILVKKHQLSSIQIYPS
jgi:hypothetical protein